MRRLIVGFAVCAALMLALIAAFASGPATAAAANTTFYIDCVAGVLPTDSENAGSLMGAITDNGGIIYTDGSDVAEGGQPTDDGEALTGAWDAFLEGEWDTVPLDGPSVASHVSLTPCAPAAPPRAADRYGYCSVAGDTYPDTSSLWPANTPIAPGTFLNLPLGQPGTDMHYTGAVPAFYVQGVGITCSLTPSQAALAAASSDKAGPGGDLENPKVSTQPGWAFYTFVPSH